MEIDRIEFDGNGDAENDLARLWTEAPIGMRERIALAANDAEGSLRDRPEAGTLITDGVHPPVRYLDCDVLRVFYQIYESENKIIIIGFRGLL
jgi:hypothetical protein